MVKELIKKGKNITNVKSINLSIKPGFELRNVKISVTNTRVVMWK